MSAPLPIIVTWDGDVFVPPGPIWRKRANERYVVGGIYTLETREERSPRSHAHYFAAVHEAWQNLPDHVAERFPSEGHLRKWALIKAGYRDERSVVCSSRTEALRLAAFIRPMDEFAVVTVTGAVVSVYTAKSQSMRAMGKAEFQRSKDAVLDVLAKMIGTSPDDLSEAGEAA